MTGSKTDQWLLEGKCLECRRYEYCRKPCTKSKRRTKAILQQMAREAILRQMERNSRKQLREVNKDDSTRAITGVSS